MSITRNEQIRNISIIAHVDHGKTTLVDAMFRQSGVFREGQEVSERLMDSLDLERERGITIAAKNCAVAWNGVKINIIDTPGHADFGGEVERTLSMADGALLLVDAAEGPLPQTRFVLSKALQDGLQVIVVINKVDRPDARPAQVMDEVYDLFIDLDASEEQLDFPVLYAVGRDGLASHEPFDAAAPPADTGERGLDPLFDTILERIPGPAIHEEQPFQMLVADLGYSDFLGRLAIGRTHNREVNANDTLVRIDAEGRQKPLRVSRLQVYQGLSMVEAKRAEAGDVVVLAGIDEVHIGDTICTVQHPKAMRRITVDEPTVSMVIGRNTSPFAGKEGSFVQSSKIGERLFKETMRNVSLQVEETENRDAYLVKGRGEFQMAILIETMRREGFEMEVGRPHVIYRRGDAGSLLEPIERLFIDCGDTYVGVVTEKLSLRKARLVNMVNHSSGRVRMEFSAPARALIGFRDELLTDTRGTGIMNAQLDGYEEYRGEFVTRQTGSLVADRQGESVPYALFNLEPRGVLFIGAGEPVYEGMIIGEHNRDNDLDVNPCKTKKLTNVRAAARDENVILTPPHTMTLEAALSFIRDDELVEVTPKSLRMRKSVLQANQRKRQKEPVAE
jgi:GTP-binding protein